jgi:hypothetical protein
MAESTTFRCYYDDGTILTNASVCPNVNANNSPLIKSELSIIEDVEGKATFPWFLIILAMIFLTSKERN